MGPVWVLAEAGHHSFLLLGPSEVRVLPLGIAYGLPGKRLCGTITQM